MGRRANKAVSGSSVELRQSIASSVKAVDIQHMNSANLLRLQERLQLGGEWGIIKFPTAWMPHGQCRNRSNREINLREKLSSSGLNEEDIQLTITTITRYVMVCFLVPMEGARIGNIFLSPTTIASSLKHACTIAKLALASTIKEQGKLFGRLDANGLRVVLSKQKLMTEVNRILQLGHRGFWCDVPNLDFLPDGKISNDGMDEPGKPNSIPFEPFSDSFISEVGWRAAWVIDELEPVLIDCVKGVLEVLSVHGGNGKSPKAQQNAKSYWTEKFLSKYEWRNSKGGVISELPFPVYFSGQGNRSAFSWPPKNLAGLKTVVRLAQTLNMVVFLISTGGRISEALSLREGNIIQCGPEGATVEGRTYKLVFANEGAPKDWPLPELAVQALVRQRELRSLFDQLNLGSTRNHSQDETDAGGLWARVGSGEAITGDCNEMLTGAIEYLGLQNELGSGRPHSHRFRKTIARLVALAIVGAPKILMDLFGHETIEMTLRYILTDPAIRGEMEVVARAQVIMMAKTAIQESEQSGGPAAEQIRKVVRDEKVRLGREFGEDDVHRLADTLTLNGTYWLLVRPGVICTKLPHQSGACNQHRGAPEPARCRSLCSNRLELAALKDDVDRAISEALKHVELCEQKDDRIGAEAWVGQIVANINRFSDLKEKWSTNSRVRAILSTESGLAI